MKPQFFPILALVIVAFILVTTNVQSAPEGQPAVAGETGSVDAAAAAEAEAPQADGPVMLEDGWEEVAPGIAYKKFPLPDPNNVYVARMDRSNPNVTIESSIGRGRLASGRETVSGMAYRYEGTLNYWGGGWGARNNVVVAINGSYFDPYSGVPYQGVVHSGWYAKRFDDCQTGSGGSGFAWKMDRSAFIGGTVSHPEAKQVITFIKSGKVQEFQGINIPRGQDQLILYTSQYDADTNTESGEFSLEVLVELQTPDLLSPDMVKGIVRGIYKNAGSTPIPFDHVVLSASGEARAKLLNNVVEGDEIGISHKIKSYEAGCDSATSSEDWNGTYASIGGAFYFLKNGEFRDFPNDAGATARHPRTAVAFNDQFIFFIVVDGRDPSLSIGMTIAELAAFTRDILGANYGIAQDGGGSSTLVINGRVMNNTFCNNVFCKGNIYLPLAAGGNTPEGEEVQARSPLEPVEFPAGGDPNVVLTSVVERLVANGLMIVQVEPKDQVSGYAASAGVQTQGDTEVRLGPGTNYASLATVPEGTDGVIVDHTNGLNGIFATGSYWWKAQFGEITGWVTDESLAGAP